MKSKKKLIKSFMAVSADEKGKIKKTENARFLTFSVIEDIIET